jgi:streptogramin lyase
MNARPIAAALAVALLTGCGASGTSNVFSPAGVSNAARTSESDAAARKHHRHVTGYARFLIPKQRKHRGRGPHFVSSATKSAMIVATAAAGGTVTTVADLSAGSSYCSGAGANRECDVPVSVPIGRDTITITTYNEAPSGGVIPTAALELGKGSGTQTVPGSGTAPSFLVYISGEIGSLALSPAFSSLAADGTTSMAMFVIDPEDFGNKPIIAGTNDPYLNPIKATLTETGGSNHATLELNGNPVTGTATLKYSTDALSLQYDGKGQPGYTTTVSLSAKNVAAQTATVSPLFVRSPAIRQNVLGLNGQSSAISPSNISISEAGLTAGAFTVTRNGCGTIATTSAVTGGPGPTATFTATGGTSPSASGCTITVTDNNTPSTSLVLPTTNTPIAGSETVSGVTVTDYGIPGASSALTVGPDGNLWMIEPPSNLAVIAPSGPPPSQPQILSSFYVPTAPIGSPPPSALEGVTAGPDGAIWVTDQTEGGATRVTTSGAQLFAFYPSNQTPAGITSSNDGTMWLASTSNETITNLTVGGAFTVSSQTPTNTPTRVIQGADGAIWFAEGNKIGRIDPSGSGPPDEIATPSSGNAVDLCAEPNGDIWFTSNSTGSSISQITGTPGNYTIANTYAGAVGSQLTGIACGVDNAIWYLDASNAHNAVGRISLNTGNARTTYPIPDANFSAQYITVGQDGSLWFTSGNLPMFGHITF